MPQLLSSKNLLLSSRPLAVGVISDSGVFQEFAAMAEGAQAAACDLVELRLDLLGLDEQGVREAAGRLRVPVLLTARHPAEGGRGPAAAAERAAMLDALLDIAALVDIELRSVPEMRSFIPRARSSGVPVVGSFHDFQATPGDEVLAGAISFAENAGLDAVKIATYVNTPDDLFRLGKLASGKHRLRLSVMGMGPWGRVSRLLLAKCGSLLNYGFLGEANAPGQWPVARLKDLLNEI
jgi:3-dehydroquinate dehydratase-1